MDAATYIQNPGKYDTMRRDKGVTGYQITGDPMKCGGSNMIMNPMGYQKPELVEVAEQLHECRARKKDLEVSLIDEKFHQRYIGKRTEMNLDESVFKLVVLIPLTIVVLGAVFYIFYYIFTVDSLVGAGLETSALLIFILLAIFGGYVAVKMWKRQWHLFVMLFAGKDSKLAKRLEEKRLIMTLQRDQVMTGEKIFLLQSDLELCEKKIAMLEEKQQQLLLKYAKQEAKQKEMESTSMQGDEVVNRDINNGGLALKEDAMWLEDKREIFDFYEREERMLQNCISDLESNLVHINREIVSVDDDFEKVKGWIIWYFIGYFILIILQSFFEGTMATATGLACFLLGIGAFFALDKKCAKPIMRYLVEHDVKWVQEYAYMNNMVPVRHKWEETNEKLGYYRKELEAVTAKKKAVFGDE